MTPWSIWSVCAAALATYGLLHAEAARAASDQRMVSKYETGNDTDKKTPKPATKPVIKPPTKTDKGPGPLNLRDMPTGLGGASTRGSNRSASPGAAELWRDGDAAPTCRPGAAERALRQAIEPGLRSKRRHNPELDAVRCISLDRGPSLFGGLINHCPHPVEVVFCNKAPVKDSWAEAFDCARQGFGMATIKAYDRVAVHTHQASSTVWAACVSPRSSVKHTPFSRNGIEYWCMESVREQAQEDAAAAEDASLPAAPTTCQPADAQRLQAERDAARQQAERERLTLEPAWLQEAQALNDEALGRPRTQQPRPPAPTPAPTPPRTEPAARCTNPADLAELQSACSAEISELSTRSSREEINRLVNDMVNPSYCKAETIAYYESLSARWRATGEHKQVELGNAMNYCLMQRRIQQLKRMGFQAAPASTTASCMHANGQHLDDVYRHLDELESSCRAELSALNQAIAPRPAVDRAKLKELLLGRCDASAMQEHERELQYFLQRPQDYTPTALKAGICLRSKRIQQLQKMGIPSTQRASAASCTNAAGQRFDDVYRHLDDLASSCRAEIDASNRANPSLLPTDRAMLERSFIARCGPDAKQWFQGWVQRYQGQSGPAERMGYCLNSRRVQQLEKMGF